MRRPLGEQNFRNGTTFRLSDTLRLLGQQAGGTPRTIFMGSDIALLFSLRAFKGRYGGWFAQQARPVQ